MVPDFGYFLPLPLTREATHSAVTLFTFCLPLGLVTIWLFQLLIKPAWCVVLPGGWRMRLRAEHPVARIGDWRVWLGAAAAVLAGAFTHLVWDAFTHEDGRGVRMLPFLDDLGPDIEGHTLHLYRLLQHASSVLGLLVVIVAAWRWTHGAIRTAPAGAQELGSRERHAWLAAYVVIPALFLLSSVIPGLHEPRPPWQTFGSFLSQLAFLGLGGTGISLTLVSALIRARVALRQRSLDA